MGKNLIIRNSSGRVVDYLPGQGEFKERIESEVPEGYEVEATEDRYVKKWGKWWLTV